MTAEKETLGDDAHERVRALATRLTRVKDDLARDQAGAAETAVETRYARSGNLGIAYQVVGGGSDLVFVPGSLSHLELGWETPPYSTMYPRLSEFARMITFDKRGTGLSDRTPELPTLEQRMDDVHAVMEAAGSDTADVVGISEGGSMAMLFAATHPERVRALVLWGTFPRMAWSPDYPAGVDPKAGDLFCDQIEQSWGHGRIWPLISIHDAPDDEATRQQLARFERNSATPAMAAAANRFGLRIDATDVLGAISTPTLVVHRQGDPLIDVAHARYLAEHIPDARLSEFPGEFHFSAAGDGDVLDEIEEFLTGGRQQRDVDRVLRTILFTDVVGSTEWAVRLGDRRWHDLLEKHRSAVRRELERFHGHEVKTLGDGLLATFDGPARAIRCAQAITGTAASGLNVRAGVHTGECEVRGDDIAGVAVHIGARVGAVAGGGEVLVTSTVRDLVAGSGIEFEDRGDHALKGIPDEWRLLAVRR